MKHAAWIAAFVLGLPALSFGGGPSTDYDWVTIGAPGNAPWDGELFQKPGWGSVDHVFRIARLEITTAQWMEFVNNYSGKSNEWGTFAQPTHWGAVPDPNYNGPGKQWKLKSLPDADQFLVSGLRWREAAMFCNWLHNGKGDSLGAIENGAYDISTFTENPDGTFNDQSTHSADAKYWIPTLDEWLKAAHFDPNRYGPGEPGWWTFSTTSDVPPAGGPPGEGQSNTGFELPNQAHWNIPVGSYPDVQSPWGLLDTSGSVAEWTEAILFDGQPKYRVIDGTYAGLDGVNFLDNIGFADALRPYAKYANAGFRIASAVPGPSTAAYFAIAVFAALRRKER